ncbi:hypothetical protein Taro_041941 [Colocasia esculenta]|uniref:Uncharacterized protein n=1 Tax=Colocasia esculenta TaxID=4460 RepID=A0A843X1J1_COLES|nr:hypothetical protein [Colocasia esculenta]
MENIQKRSFIPSRPPKDDLPISQMTGAAAPKIGLRRRFSSFSVSIQPLSSAAAASSAWAFRRSKSMSSIGELAGGSLRRWWEWGWEWILSRKPTFARDLEMNEEETTMLGFNSKGSWRHVLYKLRSELRKIVSGPVDELPTTQGFRCDSFSYAQHRHEGNVSVY